MNESRCLAQFVVDTRFEDLPTEVVEAIRVYVLDDLAAGCAGARTPWADVVVELARETSVGPCTVIGSRLTTSPAYAALCNGVMMGGLAEDHPSTPGLCHPGGAVVPAAFAMAERERSDGRAFLAAVATGYETLCRIGLAATRAVEDERGFLDSGTSVAFGAAVATGKLLGLSSDQLLHALGIAGSSGCRLVESSLEGAMTRRLHLGRGSQLGMECALLAKKGFTGPSTVLEGSLGFLQAHAPSPKSGKLLDALGERWELLAMVLKAYPCHISFHAVIDGLHAFRRARRLRPESILAIRVTTASGMLEDRFAERRPTTVTGAQYSLPWSAAMAICHDVADPGVWLHVDLHDTAVARLAEKIELNTHTDKFGLPGQSVAEVSLTTDESIYSFTVTDWKGAPSNPYTFDEVAEKFRRYAEGVLTSGRIEDVIRRVRRLENEQNLANLVGLFRAA